MRQFTLVRDVDVSGVSGTGVVAEGIRFSDGKVVIRWVGETASTVVWDSINDALKIHGHGGMTRVVWWGDSAVESKLIIAIKNLDYIGHYLDNGPATYSNEAIVAAAHHLSEKARETLELIK